MSDVRKKVLVLASTFPRWQKDNQPQFVLEFAANLSQNADVIVLAPYERGSKIHEQSGEVEIYRFPYTLPGTERLAYRGGMVNAFRESILAKIQLPLFMAAEFLFGLYLIAAKRIEVINAHWLLPQGLVGALLTIFTRRSLVITTHGGDVELLGNQKFLPLLRFATTHAEAITFVSERNRIRAIKLLKPRDPQKFFVMPMGVQIPSKTELVFKRPLNILFIGRLVGIKGVDFLLKAFSIALQKGLDAKLSILGDGPDRIMLENLADGLGLSEHIEFRGFIGGKEKTAALSLADIVVVPSVTDINGHEEGLPVAAIEALAHGKLLIGTNTGSLPELIEGGNGILIQQKNADAIARSLLELQKHPERARTIARQGYTKAQDFEWNVIISRFTRIIERKTM